jgi:hypothetical protein
MSWCTIGAVRQGNCCSQSFSKVLLRLLNVGKYYFGEVNELVNPRDIHSYRNGT